MLERGEGHHLETAFNWAVFVEVDDEDAMLPR